MINLEASVDLHCIIEMSLLFSLALLISKWWIKYINSCHNTTPVKKHPQDVLCFKPQYLWSSVGSWCAVHS